MRKIDKHKKKLKNNFEEEIIPDDEIPAELFEIPDPDEPEDIVEGYYYLKKQNKLLRKKYRKAMQEKENLKHYFNNNFFVGGNRYVTRKFARELLWFQDVFYFAKSNAWKHNKLKQYPILYQTSAKMLGKQFNINRKTAQKLIDLFIEMGLFVELKRFREYTVYHVGDRKRTNGKYLKTLSNLRLTNHAVKFFYEDQKMKLGHGSEKALRTAKGKRNQEVTWNYRRNWDAYFFPINTN